MMSYPFKYIVIVLRHYKEKDIVELFIFYVYG